MPGVVPVKFRWEGGHGNSKRVGVEDGRGSSRHHWRTVLVEGTLLVVLGAAAIVAPFVAGLVAAVLVAWLLIFSGLLGLSTSWSMRKVQGATWSAVSSVLTLLVGIAVFVWPIGGLVSLTLILGAYFTIDGVGTIASSLQHRKAGTGNWGWLLLSGVLDLLLAAAVIVLQPGVNAWLVGLVVGVDLVFAGASLIAMGWAARFQFAHIGA